MSIFLTILGLALSFVCCAFFYKQYKFATTNFNYQQKVYNGIGVMFWVGIGFIVLQSFWS